MATRLLSAQPDAVLCRLATRGNIGAYDALYQRYRQPIFAFVFHLIGRADATEDAEDISQDAFTRAFASIREKRVEGSFRGWLYTIARNRTYDVMRAKKQNVVSLDAEAAEPPAAPAAHGPAEQAEQRDEFAWLMTAVAELPERQRDALLLRAMGGLSHESIAEQLGTSVSATKKLISRGRDGIGEAAATDGYSRIARRRLGHDLAMAAPILPIGATLAGLGVTAGAGTAAAGGAVLGGKAAATALTVLAIGGGAVAVEHRAAQPADPRPEVVEQPVSSSDAARPRAGANGALPGARRSGRGEGRRESGDGSSRGGSERGDDRNGRGEETGDDRGGHNSGPGGGRRDASDDRSGDDRRGRGGSDSDSGSNSGPGGGGDDVRESSPEAPEPEPIEDHSGSESSGEGSGSGSDSSNSGPGSDGGELPGGE